MQNGKQFGGAPSGDGTHHPVPAPREWRSSPSLRRRPRPAPVSVRAFPPPPARERESSERRVHDLHFISRLIALPLRRCDFNAVNASALANSRVGDIARGDFARLKARHAFRGYVRRVAEYSLKEGGNVE